MTEKPEGAKKVGKYEYTEDELIELKKILKSRMTSLAKHPEGPDYISTKQLDDYLTRRLSDIAWKRYKSEKGL